MSDLDDPARYAEVDTADALADVERTARQWAAARDLATVRCDLDGVDAVVVSGMGGSGITGDVAAALAADRLGVPVVVRKGYGLPSFAGPRTLVVCVSYSGDTEETLSGYEEACRRGARVLAVTSGGALGKAAADAGQDLVVVPGGGQPRHCLGYLAVPVLAALGLDDGLDEALAAQRAVAEAADRAVPLDGNPAKQVGAVLAGAGAIAVYGGQGLGALGAYRLKCQLNENAKLTASAGVVPEMNHNEIVGWQTVPPGADRAVVWIRDRAGEHDRVRRRLDLCDRLLADRATSATIDADGAAPLARLASLFLLADLVSIYTAIARGVDPTPIELIDRLKRDLAPTSGSVG